MATWNIPNYENIYIPLKEVFFLISSTSDGLLKPDSNTVTVLTEVVPKD